MPLTEKLNPASLMLPGLLSLAGLLSGCQTFGGFFSPESVAEAPIKTKIQSAVSHRFTLAPGQNAVGSLAAINTYDSDTLSDIARHYGLGFNDIAIANAHVSPWTPEPDSRILLPLHYILPDAPHKGIVLNLANMRMFFYPKNEPATLYTFPIGIGRQGWSTPMGLTRIAAKTAHPSWHVPASIKREHALKGDKLPNIIPPGPDNPLGSYAMRLAIPGYLIHGTNKPYGIGMQVSHGCVQMYPEDIEVVFGKTAVGTPVRIVHQPYLATWENGRLYLEAHEPLPKWAGRKKWFKKEIEKKLKKLSSEHNAAVDWAKVDLTLLRADGIPTPILEGGPDIETLVGAAVDLEHPDLFYGQPLTGELGENDWSMRVASFNDEKKAQKLTAMLNHQGPPIPARKIYKDNAYHVIAGPYKNKQEVAKVAKRLRIDFELKAEPLKPRSTSIN